MPELPEVETVKNGLKPLIIGKTISDVAVYYGRIIKNVSPEEFRNRLIGQTFTDIRRKGKYLQLYLTDSVLISHLRMEGKYRLRRQEPPEKHEHIVFSFSDGTTLRYHDTRKFGTMYLYPLQDDDKLLKLPPLCTVGPDPFDEINPECLYEKIHKIKRPIKSVLLDQTIISGLGNIYANEVCFLSRLHPLTPAELLTPKQVNDLLENARIILSKAIAFGGTTIRSFQSSHEISGKFQNELMVHGKTNCPNCQGKIIKIYVGGRGTYLCENCQKSVDKEGRKD